MIEKVRKARCVAPRGDASSSWCFPCGRNDVSFSQSNVQVTFFVFKSPKWWQKTDWILNIYGGWTTSICVLYVFIYLNGKCKWYTIILKFPGMTDIESNFTIYQINCFNFIITHQGVGFFLGRLPGPESTPSPVNVKLHQLSPGPPWKHQPNEVRNPLRNEPIAYYFLAQLLR